MKKALLFLAVAAALLAGCNRIDPKAREIADRFVEGYMASDLDKMFAQVAESCPSYIYINMLKVQAENNPERMEINKKALDGLELSSEFMAGESGREENGKLRLVYKITSAKAPDYENMLGLLMTERDGRWIVSDFKFAE